VVAEGESSVEEVPQPVRSTFYVDGETVVSLVIGTREIYKG